MKKRILALALAGTTAFSVFGAALSANAWDQNNTTDTRYDVDAYQSYLPVATEIEANYTGATEATSTTYYFDKLLGRDITDSTGANVTTKDAALKVLEGYNTIKENYNEYKYLTLGAGTNVGYFYIDFTNLTDAILWPTTSDESNLSVKVIGTDGLSIYKLSKHVVRNKVHDAGSNVVTYTYQEKDENGAAVGKAYDTLIDLLNAKATVANQTKLVFPATSTSGDATIEGEVQIAADKISDYYAANVYAHVGSATEATDADGSVVVDGYKNDFLNEIRDYALWTFNPDLSGEVTVEPYTVSTSLGTDGKLDIIKTRVNTIYAYDFLYTNSTSGTAGTIASAWNAKNETAAAAALVPLNYTNGSTVTLTAETGRGRVGVGIRYDVVTDWEDFMEELALNDEFHYSEGWTEFRANYLDMFYSDPVFDRWTGELVGSVDVDLYNIEGLLWDIWQLHNKADYYQANTSELIYLMQQYEKYIGEYIDKAEVTSDDWGDLLLSILDAATESDFRSASEYRKYQNEVEDLRDAYEMATTVNMIREVEAGMYSLLTSANSKFRSAAAPDKATLGATLEGLFFNVGNVPTEYSVLPSNQSTNVDYSNYNYYVAALNNTFTVGIITTNNIPNSLGFSNSLSRGYYSLYPALDYLQANNTAMQYPGNGTAGTNYGVSTTDEYEWFLNVYELAANMNALGSGSSGNTKQGSVDAVNDALVAAVADLAVVTSPNSVELGAVEDAMTEYEGKIESDYDEGYYGKYEQAYDYAENIAEGKWQTRIAAMITGVAGEALTYQGTQVTVTKNQMKELEASITAGKTALEAIKNSADYNAAQVNALNKAIDAAQYIVDLYEGTVTRYDADIQSVNHVATALVGDKDQYVVSDVENAMAAIDAAINYSEIVMGWSKTEAGKWQYGTDEGYLNDGWHQVDGGKTWFYFNADGTAKQSEWWNDNGTWYWFNSNCGAATGWAKVDGEWYFFKGNNAMKTGWEKVDGNWYYMASSGKMVTGWCEVNGKWYYFSKASNSLGQMLYSTTVDGYKLGADGAWIK